MENQDKNVDQIVQDVNNFVKPKLIEMRDMISSNNTGLFNLMTKMKKYLSDISEEYRNIYNRSFEDDLKILNNHFGNNNNPIFDFFKKN